MVKRKDLGDVGRLASWYPSVRRDELLLFIFMFGFIFIFIFIFITGIRYTVVGSLSYP